MSVPTLRCTLRILQCSHTDRRKCYNRVYVCIMEVVLVSKMSVAGAHWGTASGFCLSAHWQFRDSRATIVIELKP